MRRVLFFLPLFLALLVSGSVYGQSKQLEKQRKKMYKSKIKEYKKEGWKLDSNSKTIEVVLLEHFEKIKDENNREIIGSVSNCRSINVCRQAAYNNAITTYANLSASTVKGRVTSDLNLNASDADNSAEFDKLYAAYERIIKTEINNGVLVESYSIKKKSRDSNEYQVFFLINEEKALQARKRSMQRALEETKLAQEYAKKISDFVNEGIEQSN